MDTLDRRERTVYVSGMHPSVSEETLYDLFMQAGPVEKVVLHEYPDGSPRHALIVFKHVQSVMYSIAMLNGSALFDRPLSMRPLRESSHAAVLQQMVANQRRAPLQQANQQQPLAPPTPPTSPTLTRPQPDKAAPIGGDASEEAMIGGPRPLSQRQDSATEARNDGGMRGFGARPKDTQMWKKYTTGATSAASGGISDWFPATTAYGGAPEHFGPWGRMPAPAPGFCAPIPPGFQQTGRYQGQNCGSNYGSGYGRGAQNPTTIDFPHTAVYYSGLNGAWSK